MWVQQNQLQLTRVQELLAQGGVRCSHTALLRFVRRSGWGLSRAAWCALPRRPCDVPEIDYGSR
jgi:transposase